MENENTNENKKKQKVAILIGIVTLLIAVLGATYAYFQIDTNTESSNTKITGSTPDSSLVTLTPGTDNLHLNISASDMSLANATKEYYGTDGDEPYVGTEDLGTKTIASVELTGGEATTKYSCTAKLTVSKVTEDENADTMIDVLHSGDMILQFKGNIINNNLDLSELNPSGKKEYDLKFNISGGTPEEIQAYIKLVNKNETQNYLSGKKLSIDISTSELKCEVSLPDPKIAELRANDTQGYLSKDLQGDMYRYQAAPADETEAAQMSNWICFGTKSKDDCTNPDTGIDKYMYRIIGITDEGQMYLIKETFLKEESGKSFTWNDKYSVDSSNTAYCDDGICPEWNTSLLFKRINGTSNGETQGTGTISNNANTDIFVDSSEYEYLKSGDTNSGGEASDWYNLIAGHEWLYGDIAETSTANKYNGDQMYAIEHGDKETTHYVGTKDNITQANYTWSQKANGKISLMYLHDYYYSYYDGTDESTRGNAGSYSKLKNSWIHFQKDGYNTSPLIEWLSTRWGVNSASGPLVAAFNLYDDGFWNRSALSYAGAVRPVFYLESSAKIASGDGTKANPYILDLTKDSF